LRSPLTWRGARYRFDEHVEAPRRDHCVVDLGRLGQHIGHLDHVPVGAHADHRLTPEPELHGVGDRHDLDHSGLLQANVRVRHVG
jgi:hypothetical protein